MHDLALFRSLAPRDGEPATAVAPDALCATLASVAALSLNARLAFLPRVEPHTEHPAPRVRAAALGALAGAQGPLALKRMISALDDDDASVRTAALAALHTSLQSGNGGLRWVHALFHRRPDVRLAALERGAPAIAAQYEPLLLADPVCAPTLRARMAPATAVLPSGPDAPAHAHPTLSVSPSAIGAILDLFAEGRVTALEARELLHALPSASLLGWIDSGARRPLERLQPWVNGLASTGLVEAPGADALDELFAAYWCDADEPFAQGFIKTMLSALQQRVDLRARAVASALTLSLRKKPADAGAAPCALPSTPGWLVALFHLELLELESVALDDRRRALSALPVHGSITTYKPATIDRLAASSLAKTPSGEPDLRVLGALLGAVHKGQAAALDRWVGRKTLLEILARDPSAGADFFRLDDPVTSAVARELIERDRSKAVTVRALFARMAPLSLLDWLEALEPSEALELCLALLDPPPGARVMNPKRVLRLATLVAPRLTHEGEHAVIDQWLGPARDGAVGDGFVTALFTERMRARPPHEFALEMSALPERHLLTLTRVLGHCPGLPYEHEIALARRLTAHRSRALRAWGEGALPADAPMRPALAAGTPLRALTKSEADRIATCRDAELVLALEPCFVDARTGLTAALARRLLPQPSVAVCAALLGSLDAPRDIDAQFTRFSHDTPAFVSDLDARAVAEWSRAERLTFLGHAWLYRWEAHARAALDELLHGTDDAAPGLVFYAGLASPLLARRAWEVLAEALSIFRFRDKPRLSLLFRETLALALVHQLGAASPVCDPAARTLAAAHAARLRPVERVLERVRPRAIAMLPDANEAVRARLAAWISSEGLPPAAPRASAPRRPDAPDLSRETDLHVLEAALFDSDPRAATDAALRLAEIGDKGAALVLDALTREPSPPHARALAESAQLWPAGPTLNRIVAVCESPSAPRAPVVRFTLAMAALERGRHATDALRCALAAACEPDEAHRIGWFETKHYERLVAHAGDTQSLALALARSPHPHAYTQAVTHLLERPAAQLDDAALASLADFLEAGPNRLASLRIRAAEALAARGDLRAMPLLWSHAFTPGVTLATLLEGRPSEEITALCRAVLLAGSANANESVLLSLLEKAGTFTDDRAEGYELLLTETLHASIRDAVVLKLPQRPGRALKLRRIAETFAWGVRMGRELTGRLFAVEMAAGNALGYTRMTESRIFVSPLPILRRERRAQDVVEGLILHELGHQIYHRSPESLAAWEQAQKENLGGLLNLVADEHLERNLRALDAEFGDRLKRLGAYAFQHTVRELAVAQLVRTLRARTFDVLSTAGLSFARDEASVRVESGALLAAMERAGMPFARFMRALRMNLGNRHGDAKVAQGLALFAQGFRKKTMPQMLEIARELARIFGGESELGGMIGANEGIAQDGAEKSIHGEGITQDEVRREVERITDPAEVERRSKGTRREGTTGKPASPGWLNAVDNERFDPITKVVPVPHDKKAHGAYADRVRRPATEMRRYFAELGLAYVPQRMRLRGRRIDQTRIRALVLERNPRILVARERQVRTDLFIGIVIDCSGSMSSRDHMERARLFGTLLAESARGFPGIDVRVFGFTDRIIYDAGNAELCAAHALNAGGGNNDAGALWHAAQVAHQSRRKAKLLVMISDGLPTECTVSALRSLVRNLRRRWNICCAQVAVQPLSEVCFPHYVVLEGMNVDAAVRRFGGIVAGLVRTTLRE